MLARSLSEAPDSQPLPAPKDPEPQRAFSWIPEILKPGVFLSLHPDQTMNESSRCRVTGERSLHRSRWTEVGEIDYVDGNGQPRTWECVHRAARAEAVIIVATLKPSGKVILVRQFRPPVGGPVLEFPAGLVDPGEGWAEAAVRELKEETGYSGNITTVGPRGFSSPGLLSEGCAFARLEVDETLAENQNPVHEREPSEFMEVLLVEPEEIGAVFAREITAGVSLDIKLYAWFASRLLG